MDSWETLYPGTAGIPMPPAREVPAAADTVQAGKRKAASGTDNDDEGRKKRMYSMSVGPKFRKGHETPFRATNVQMITSGGSPKKLLAGVMKEIDSGISFSDDCDIVLNSFIHPESPKLITIALNSIDREGILDPDLVDVRVPLYISLTDMQWEDVKSQMGMDDQAGAWAVEMNRARRVSSAPPAAYFSSSSASVSASSLESFVNEVMGRFARYNTSNESTWDKNQKFFQPIEFKIRVGPQFRHRYEGLARVRRGQNFDGDDLPYNTEAPESREFEGQDDQKNVYDGDILGTSVMDSLLGAAREQLKKMPGYKAPKSLAQPQAEDLQTITDEQVRLLRQAKVEIPDLRNMSPRMKAVVVVRAVAKNFDKLNMEKPSREFGDSLKRWAAIEDQQESREDMLINLNEDGLEQAAIPEHRFRMTSHMALSPAFRSAIRQAMSYLDSGAVENKSQFEDTYLRDSQIRAHMATIVESELKETDVSITRYQDPQALAAVKRKKTFAAYSIKKKLQMI